MGPTAPSDVGRYTFAMYGGACNARNGSIAFMFVAAIGPEQGDVTFDTQASLGENVCKLLAEISIGEVGPSHAARE